MPTVGERASDKLTPYRGWFYAPHDHEPKCLKWLIAAASCARIPPGGDGQATEDADIVKPRNGGPARCIFAGPRRRAASAFRWVLAASNGAFAGRGTVLFGVVHLCVRHAAAIIASSAAANFPAIHFLILRTLGMIYVLLLNGLTKPCSTPRKEHTKKRGPVAFAADVRARIGTAGRRWGCYRNAESVHAAVSGIRLLRMVYLASRGQLALLRLHQVGGTSARHGAGGRCPTNPDRADATLIGQTPALVGFFKSQAHANFRLATPTLTMGRRQLQPEKGVCHEPA
jgi:hypothetical protein